MNLFLLRMYHNKCNNILFRHSPIRLANMGLYAYDGVSQIKSLGRGKLNADRSGVTSPSSSESWNYDATGNWLQYDKNGSVENRVHNTANEIQTSCTHDKNGNMTVLPGMTCKYDAWNRLVEVGSNIRYDYNGLNQRVKKTVAGVTTTSFFNRHWQELETTEPQSSDCVRYIWGTRYIDDLVLRERGTERLYSLADANWNVVALTNDSGVVQERMKYDAFGKVSWMNAAFASKANSAYAWNRTFTGQVLDAETGLILYRNRYYHTGLGRFVTRDPMGYSGDYNLMRYVRNSPLMMLDSYGLDAKETFIAAFLEGYRNATQRRVDGVPLQSARIFKIDTFLIQLFVNLKKHTYTFKIVDMGGLAGADGVRVQGEYASKQFSFPATIDGVSAIHETAHAYNDTVLGIRISQYDEALAYAIGAVSRRNFADAFAFWERTLDGECPVGNNDKMDQFMESWNNLWSNDRTGVDALRNVVVYYDSLLGKKNRPITERDYQNMEKKYGIHVSCENYRAWSMEKIRQQWGEKCSIDCIAIECPDTLWSVFK